MNNKKLKVNQFIDNNNNLNNNNCVIKRDSFSDRFCDDLTEVLLSYLSFEDKIQLECVSHQFQRLIYNKQYVIKVNEYNNYKDINKLNSLLIKGKRNYLPKYRLNLKAFESVLKKCKFINNIKFDFNLKNKITKERALKLIMKYCRYLKKVHFNFNQLSDNTLILFGEQFGQKLTKIAFEGPFDKTVNKYKPLLRLCPNIVSFCDRTTELSLFIDENELLVPKLSEIVLSLGFEDIHNMEMFCNNYKNSMRRLHIELSSNIINNVLVKQISKLINLENLFLNFSFIKEDSSIENIRFIDNLTDIAFNCKQLNKLELCLFDANLALSLKIFNCMRLFKQLNYLDLCLDCEQQNDDQISCQSLKGLKLLTHLSLDVFRMNDHFFEDINVYLPQLKQLEITVVNNCISITDKTLISLSKLLNLKCIKFRAYFDFQDHDMYDIMPYITDTGLLNIINNCPQIKSIIFETRPNITHKTIEALIELALRKPKIQFNHQFLYIGLESGFDDDIEFTAIDLKSFNNLPNNLIIE